MSPRSISEQWDGEAKSVPFAILGEPCGEISFHSTAPLLARVENGQLTYGVSPGAAMIIVEASRDEMVVSRRYVQLEMKRSVVPTDWTSTGYVRELTGGTWNFHYFTEWYDAYGCNVQVKGDLTRGVHLDRDYMLTFEVWGEIESMNPDTMDTLDLYINKRKVRRFNPVIGSARIPLGPFVIMRHAESIDMSAYTGQTVSLRFHWDTRDQLYQKFDGWFVSGITLHPIGG